MEKETEEDRQHGLAAQKGTMGENIENQILNETPDEMQSGLEKTRMYHKIYKRRVQDLTPEELEKRRRMDRERWKNMTEEQRQRKREQARVANIKRKMKETPEQRAKRHAIIATCYRRRMMQMTEAEREARLERARKISAEKRMQETEEERERRLERCRLYNERYSASNQTPEEREAKLQGYRERYKNMTVEQRQRINEMARLRYTKRKKNETGQQRAKASYESTNALDTRNSFNESNPRPGRSAKSKAGGNIRHQLEHETPEADLKNSDDSTDALDFRISNNQSDEKIYDSNAATDRTTKSNGKESEDCSMTLAKKWGLRPLVVRLERIDVAELVHKVKQEPAAIDDSAGVKVKRTKNPNGCVDAPSARITRWL